MRVLSLFDRSFFENELIKIMQEFLKSVASQSSNIINNQSFDFYTEFSHEKFIDEYEEYELKDEEKLYSIESAHYVLCFLFDLLQFSF